MKKHFTAHLVFAASSLMSQQAWALGFGRVVPDAVLGQTLTVIVPVHVEPGERFGADCVAAEVYFGESRLLPDTVRTAVEQGSADNEWLVRITTTGPVLEPVVEISLSAGCGRRFVRRFTAFADPPTLAAPDGQAAQVQPDMTSSAASALAPVAAASKPASPSPRRARGAAQGGSGGTPHAPGVVRKGPTMALANELTARSEGRAGNRPAAGAPPAMSRSAVPAAAEASRLVLDGGFAHLKLDMEDPIVPPAGAVTASTAPSDMDDPDARKLRSLEQNIQAIRRDSQINRDQATKLQAELAEAQAHSDLLPYVLGLLALAVAAVVALAWRLRQQSRLRAHSAWFESQHSIALEKEPVVVVAPPAPAPVVVVSAPVLQPDAASSFGGELVGEDSSGFGDTDSPSEFPLGSDVSATQPLNRAALAGLMAQEAASPREMAVEELLDLEQQADFFIALGQEDAAVDLLMSHLRSAGGQSPLPYTKLLEIYRRQGDRSAYERTRARFNRRFNAYAPDWDAGPASGRSLEDYPETVAQIQDAWRSPIDAMAVLEALLFKRVDTSELFDLPAYRDVLVLYSLARDLWQHEGGPTSGVQVDVLLPLDDAEFGNYVPLGASAAVAKDLQLPVDAGLPTSYDMQEFKVSGGVGSDLDLDLEVPILDEPTLPQGGASRREPEAGDGVHLTLDAFSLAPIEPTRPPPSPLDWDIGLPATDPKAPKRS